jgi:tRNA (guanine37-N1)-methyltransferase
MKIDILTLFPEMFAGPFSESIIKRAQNKGLVQISIHNLRTWTSDKRGTVDDRPYGGGPGMVMMIEPIDCALAELRTENSRVILLDPGGTPFSQKIALAYRTQAHLILICGHYEGVDERVKSHLVDETVSIGDYVLTGGELPAMVVVDATLRLIPGVLGKDESSAEESFSQNLLEYPQYTRPEDYRGWKVPKVLMTGNHEEIRRWREKKAREKTKKVRPDLL